MFNLIFKIKMLPYFIKTSIAKVLSIFNFYINYPGLRFETRNLKKSYNSSSSGITIVCIGDSNTFGWNNRYHNSYPALLEDNLRSEKIEASVINCGIGGETIKDGINRIEKDVLFFKPELAIINFGFNDARLFKIERNNNLKKKSNPIYLLNGDYYFIKTGMEDFRDTFNKFIKKLQGNSVKVILAGLYKVNKIKKGIFYSSSKELVDLQNDVYGEYDICIKDIASKNNISFLDLWNNLNNYEKIKNCLQIDGVHVGREGYKLIAEKLSGIIIKNCFLK
jgi:lysophospholipase L1-like esterase